MMAVIKISLHLDANSGNEFYAIHLGQEHVGSFWHQSVALACAKRLADICSARLHSAEVIAFPKAVA